MDRACSTFLQFFCQKYYIRKPLYKSYKSKNSNSFSNIVSIQKPNLPLVKRCEIQSRRVFFSIHRRCQFLFSFVSTAMSVWLWDDEKKSVFPTVLISSLSAKWKCMKSVLTYKWGLSRHSKGAFRIISINITESKCKFIIEHKKKVR